MPDRRRIPHRHRPHEDAIVKDVAHCLRRARRKPVAPGPRGALQLAASLASKRVCAGRRANRDVVTNAHYTRWARTFLYKILATVFRAIFVLSVSNIKLFEPFIFILAIFPLVKLP